MLTDEEKQKIKDEEEYRAKIKSEKKSKETLQGCLGFVIFLIVLAFIVYTAGSEPETEEQKAKKQQEYDFKECNNNLYGAGLMAQKLVKNKLLSPTSAKFPEDPKVIKINPCHYRAIGKVDSSNAFGAIIRSTYVAEVGYLGGDKWRLLSVNFEE
jgi:hypothetical protein